MQKSNHLFIERILIMNLNKIMCSLKNDETIAKN